MSGHRSLCALPLTYTKYDKIPFLMSFDVPFTFYFYLELPTRTAQP